MTGMSTVYDNNIYMRQKITDPSANTNHVIYFSQLYCLAMFTACVTE